MLDPSYSEKVYPCSQSASGFDTPKPDFEPWQVSELLVQAKIAHDLPSSWACGWGEWGPILVCCFTLYLVSSSIKVFSLWAIVDLEWPVRKLEEKHEETYDHKVESRCAPYWTLNMLLLVLQSDHGPTTNMLGNLTTHDDKPNSSKWKTLHVVLEDPIKIRYFSIPSSQ